MPETRPTVRIGSPEDLIAITQVIVGYQPANSFVVIGIAQNVPVATLRYNLPAADQAADMAAHAAGVLSANDIEQAAAIGYGPGVLVTPAADALRRYLPTAGIAVMELLRIEGRRYWSYMCTSAGCHSADGTLFDPDARPAGLEDEPVLTSREELVASVAPVTGEASESMTRATSAAEDRAQQLMAGCSGRRARRNALTVPGLDAVSEAIGRYWDGDGRLSHDEAAWLALVLADTRIRDDAWSRMDPSYKEAHLRLWTDLTRLAHGRYVAAPATLLAFVAWQSGNGALANVALDRALADDPHYSMALLLRQALDSGAPPSMARLPMTPEDVAASYEAMEGE